MGVVVGLVLESGVSAGRWYFKEEAYRLATHARDLGWTSE